MFIAMNISNSGNGHGGAEPPSEDEANTAETRRPRTAWTGLLFGAVPMVMGACASVLPWVVLSPGPIHTGWAPSLSGFQRGWGWVSFMAAIVSLGCYLAGMFLNEKWFIVAAMAGNLIVTGVVVYNLWFATGEYYGTAPWGLFVGLAGGILGLIFMFFAFMVVTSRG